MFLDPYPFHHALPSELLVLGLAFHFYYLLSQFVVDKFHQFQSVQYLFRVLLSIPGLCSDSFYILGQRICDGCSPVGAQYYASIMGECYIAMGLVYPYLSM